MTMKLALPLASPHCRLRCWVLPAIWRGLLWAPWTTPLEGLQGTPLGVVLSPHRESHAGQRGAGVDEAEDWDALEVELAGDEWPYRTPNRGHLGLR